MNMPSQGIRIACTLAAALAASPAPAAEVAVVNPSFEQDSFAGEFTVTNAVSGWRALGESGQRGLLAPETPGIQTFYSGATPGVDGNNIEFHWNGQSGIEQVLTERLQANTRYTLTVASGTRNGGAGAFGRYDIRLTTQTGKPVVSWSGASRNLAAPGAFADTGRDFETGANPPGLGERLRIELRGSPLANTYVDLDNVRLTATPVAARPAAMPIDVFIVSGQSNSQGWGANSARLSAANRHYADAPDPRALLGYRQHLLGDALASIGSMAQLDTQGSGFHGNYDGFGPELALGSDYAVGSDKPVAIIKYAVGMAGLAQNFVKTGASATPLYPTLIQHIHAMLAELRGQGYAPTLRAMFWLQGESDALFGTGSGYGANLSRFMADVRADVQAPQLRFYLTQINPNMPSFAAPAARTGMQQVNDGMVQAADADPQRVFYVRTDDIGAGFADDTHYSADQTIDIGRRWAARYLSGP
ncbi:MULTISPECIES: sialate O-acetylesterase [unclassified Lysobacter]|uniref:sialate O-acetylesterase n=1 Tax=unclassified Lysobacter TaxID=2635362 RepID=UPI001BEABEF9|nr:MULTISPECIES: sialate O-acetylesterase [unclassified Lysobacter]MBT2746341.1 hypothetical protein [Lysobacter sp. ISL-42]MBT2751186.1 hypothetical protein [Lysobacter sp. ISL-50]MBT2775594.1 hypothetical protein [Lysobacter sp. ISL-54]MBT2779979.1 hypothetical protein [Lysobacter sp. ISL-52]